jgi:chemotaxis protein MotB
MAQTTPHSSGSGSSGLSSVWLVIFADLVALMLTFFVMLFSMSNVTSESWQKMVDALADALNPTSEEKIDTTPDVKTNIDLVFRRQAINLDYLQAVLEQKVIKSKELKGSQLTLLEDRLVVSLPGSLLFGANSAVLKKTAKDPLFSLGGLLGNVENRLGINGYADEKNFEGTKYNSNWELSLARSISVGNAFRQAGYSGELLNFGYGNAHSPYLKNADKDQREILSRRIDIVILESGGDK